MPNPLDPLTGRPQASVLASGTHAGFKSVIEKIRQTEAGMPGHTQSVLQAAGLTGFAPGRTGMAAERFMGRMSSLGYQYKAELMDEGANLRFHLLHGIKDQAKSVGAYFDIPVERGGYVQLLPKAVMEPGGYTYAEGVKRASFVARGGVYKKGESWKYQSWFSAVTSEMEQKLGAAPVSGPAELRQLARGLRGVVSSGFKRLVWSGGEYGDLAAKAPYTKTGSIYDIFQMGVVGVYQGPGSSAGALIDQNKSKFAFLKGEFLPERSLEQITKFQAEMAKELPGLSMEAIKAETGLAGNLGVWKLGQIAPFGGYADPAAQTYQRLAIAQLIGSDARYVTPVSTPIVEAMKSATRGQTMPGGASGRFSVESRIALVMDPRFETAVAGSGGGAIITPKLASQLAADYTDQAKADSARWAGMIEEGGGRAVSRTRVGTNLITSLGTKQTVGGIRQMSGAQMAIGWSTFLKGKNPEAVREAVIRDVVQQVGGWGAGVKGSAAIAARNKATSAFYRDLVTDVLGGKAKMAYVGEEGRRGLAPQLLIDPEATFAPDQLTKLSQAIDKHNQRLGDLRASKLIEDTAVIRKGFEFGQLELGTHKLASFFVSASIMRRLESPEVVLKTAGAWTLPVKNPLAISMPEGFPRGKERYYTGRAGEARQVVNSLYNPSGARLQLADVTNLRMWHTKEANDLAGMYEHIIKNWRKDAKAELSKTVMPFGGLEGLPSAFPSFENALTAAQLRKKFGHFQPTSGMGAKKIEEMAGTIWAEGSPLRKTGVAIKLPGTISIANIPGVSGEGILTQQIYLPGLEMYKGIREEAIGFGARESDVDLYMGKLQKAHERLFLSLTAKNPSTDKVQELAGDFYNKLAQAMGGKKGMLSYFSSAPMAHSGYLGLVAGGMGPLAREAGTALPGNAFAHISETTAKEMGVYDLFRKKGTVYGRVTAYPGIGPTMETVLGFKMVSDSALGSKNLRISNALALTMFRDFDADKAAVTFFTGKRAERYMKAFYKKTALPRISMYGKAWNELTREDPELAGMLMSSEESTKAAGQAIKDATIGGRNLSYEAALLTVATKDKAVAGRLTERIAEKFGTKALTPAVNWYTQSFREIIGAKGMEQALISQGYLSKEANQLVGKSGYTGLQLASAAIGLFEQQSAISKGKGILPASSSLVRLLGAGYRLEGSQQLDVPKFEQAVKEGTGYLADLVNSTRGGGAAEAARGTKFRGEYLALADDAKREAAMRNWLGYGQARLDILENTGRLPMRPRQLLFNKAESEAQAATMFHGLQGIAERQAALADTPEAVARVWAEHEKRQLGLMGVYKQFGFNIGVDEAALESQKAARLAGASATQSAVNQLTKEAGATAGRTVLDRVAEWWTNAGTPYWQKAGVITGAALIMGAVAKNTFFGRYGPDDPSPIAQPLAFTPPPPIVPGPPIARPRGPNEAPELPYNMGKKPGGLWARVGRTLGLPPEAYGAEAPSGMPGVRPAFGNRVNMAGVGLDLGPGIADSDSRPLILAGPPVGSSPPIPPAIPQAGVEGPGVPYSSPLSEPPARMQTPDYMRQGMTVRATAPEGRWGTQNQLEGSLSELGTPAEVINNRWDPSEGIIDRHMASLDEESSSFV